MTPELAYFLKVNLAIAIFYAFYRLFFYKDTFFRLRRTILLAFFGIAFLYPLLNIQEWIKEQEPIADVVTLYATILPEVTPISETVHVNWLNIASTVGLYGYFGGILFLVIRFILQLSSILILATKCKKEKIGNLSVRLLNKPAGPFSFFKLIFIHKESHSSKETEEILTHENTHARQYHSIDVIICELLSIICWINPFIWLLKREVRHNLEYLADNTVLQAGYDSKSYQYHLLGLAHHQSTANIYNSFNVLHLKNRISMMNKKRSKGIGRTKYFMFIPLAGVLMLLSNIEAVARVTKSLTKQITDNNVEVITKVSIAPPIAKIMPNKAMANEIIVTAERESISTNKKESTLVNIQNTSSTIDKQPQFPGGKKSLTAFINQNLKYPVTAQENGIQGKIIMNFVINKDGHISDLESPSKGDPLLIAEAKRVILSMPNWTPGELKGEKVVTKHTLPITFTLQETPSEKDENSNNITNSITDEVSKPKDSNMVFTVVEKSPQYRGGDAALLKYINSSIKYPDIALENGIQGRVYCEFIITKDGDVENCIVKRGVDPSLDNEALRIIRNMPKWEPGTQKGNPVNVRFTVPITFKLDDKGNPAYTKISKNPSLSNIKIKQDLNTINETTTDNVTPVHTYSSFNIVSILFLT